MIHPLPHPMLVHPRRDHSSGLFIAGTLACIGAVLAAMLLVARLFEPAETLPGGVAAVAMPASGEAPKAVNGPTFEISRALDTGNKGYGFQHILLTVVVQLTDDSGKFATARGTQLENLQAQFVAEHPQIEGRLADALITTVDSFNATQLRNPQGREAFREALSARMNEQLAGSGHQVVYVSFTNFVLTA